MKADRQLNCLRHMGHLQDNNPIQLKFKVNNLNNRIHSNILSREFNISSNNNNNNNNNICINSSTNNNNLCRDLLSRNKPNNKDPLLKTIRNQINTKGIVIILNLLSKDSNSKRAAKNKILQQISKILKTPVKMTMIHLHLF